MATLKTDSGRHKQDVYSHGDAQNEQQKVQESHESETRKGAQKAPSPAPDGKMRFEPQERPHEDHEKKVAVDDRCPDEIIHAVSAGVGGVGVDHVALDIHIRVRSSCVGGPGGKCRLLPIHFYYWKYVLDFHARGAEKKICIATVTMVGSIR